MIFVMKEATVKFKVDKSTECILFFSVYSKNIDKCLRILCFFCRFAHEAGILPIIHGVVIHFSGK